MSQPRPADIRAALGPVGIDRVMWGSDYPHEEGTQPFTREHLRQVMGHLEPEQIQQIVGGNTRRALRLRHGGAASGGREVRPDGGRDRHSRSSSCPRARTRRCSDRQRNSRRRADVRMRLEPEDDLFHAPDDDQNYNESRYYNFFDPTAVPGASVAGCGWATGPTRSTRR